MFLHLDASFQNSIPVCGASLSCRKLVFCPAPPDSLHRLEERASSRSLVLLFPQWKFIISLVDLFCFLYCHLMGSVHASVVKKTHNLQWLLSPSSFWLTYRLGSFSFLFFLIKNLWDISLEPEMMTMTGYQSCSKVS